MRFTSLLGSWRHTLQKHESQFEFWNLLKHICQWKQWWWNPYGPGFTDASNSIVALGPKCLFPKTMIVFNVFWEGWHSAWFDLSPRNLRNTVFLWENQVRCALNVCPLLSEPRVSFPFSDCLRAECTDCWVHVSMQRVFCYQEACPIKYKQPIMCCFLLSIKHKGSSGGRQVFREVILKWSVVGDVFVCFSLQFLQLPEKKIMYIDDVAIRNY